MENQEINKTVTLYYSDFLESLWPALNWTFGISVIICLLIVIGIINATVPEEYFIQTIIYLGTAICMGIFIVFLVTLFDKTIVVENGAIKTKYKFLKSKNSERNLSDCTGYFSYFKPAEYAAGVLQTMGQPIQQNEFGIFLAFKNKIIKFSEPQAPKENLDVCIKMLDNKGVKNYSSENSLYPEMHVTSVERIAKKTFKDPNYKPSALDKFL